MRLFMAGLATETNTFSPLPTGRAAFFGNRFYRQDASRQPAGWGNLAMREWRSMAEAEGIEVTESLSATAQPAGLTVRAVYEELRGLILEDLRAAPRPDIVLLSLHGAMVADGYEDCEGDLATHIRAIVGPEAVIGIELDLHCHLTEGLHEATDLIVLYKEYPHTDIADRARDLFALALRAARREIRPVMVFRDLRMSSSWRTPVEPVRSLVDEMTAAEGRDGLLSVSFGHGFAWADIADVGAKMIAIADGDAAVAEAAAERFARRIWDLRHETSPRRLTVDEALDAILAAPAGKPVIVADSTDNAGGGAPSDATHFLRRCVDRNLRDIALGAFWDPVAVSICQEAGVGAKLPLRVGGKVSRNGGLPVDLDVTIRALAPNHEQTGLSGARGAMGASAWVEAGGLHLLLNSNRQQIFHPDAFEGIGCRLGEMRGVVVKSSQHFYAGFAPIAGEVLYASTSGTMSADLAALPYTRRRHPYWPRVEDPFAS
ncbi:M81 family metallopeptidase [Roseococcus pinisoli]|uniref:Microcystinase C n=1 Tax=Roseococcus pinisoli TaxID=2835040 RepID=A0ABS5QHS7_9PROT|nr:M81 family metallopeptidase [Roseococcus pinisoli]MBS7812903.1 M81 family metallopeptidase [Roseococcus pinisoli]